MTITVRKGKVVIRLGKSRCTVDPEEASKFGLEILDAAKKAAGQ